MLSRRRFSALLLSPLAAQTPAPELAWQDAASLTLEGLAFPDRKSPYDRLPARAEGVVRPEVWNLSRDSAGVAVRFISNATAIHARWSLTRTRLSGANMTPIGASGLDLYVKTPARAWRWLGVGRPTKTPDNQDVLAPAIDPGEREYRVYFPLYNGVTRLEIGVPRGASLRAAEPRPPARKPIVFYGTSITHGASASRPGLCHPAILGRRLDREIINLGFSGNGRMELEVVQFLAELDPAVYVLDCLPNITAAEVRARTGPCVQRLRAARPATPILLVEDRNYSDSFLNPQRRERNATSQQALREVYAQLRRDKVPNLHYLAATHLLDPAGDDTVDGSHPTDAGFQRHADAFEKPLRKLLR
jgi:lysophospholipase L1-like esterase